MTCDNSFSLLTVNQFSLEFSKIVNTTTTLQTCNLPTLSLPKVNVSTPFSKMQEPGDMLTFGDFNVSFKADEHFKSYLDIFNWLNTLGFPKKHEQYSQGLLNSQRKNHVADATLTLLTNSSQPNISISYRNIFPVFLSDINLTTIVTETEYINCQASFAYDYFEIEYLD